MVIGDFEPRKPAVRQLHRQQESHRPLGALPEAGSRQRAAQGEKGRYDVPRRLRVRRRPPAIELVSAGDATVRLRILRCGQPLGRRAQMILVSKSVPEVALAIKCLAQQKRRMPTGPRTVTRQTFKIHMHPRSRLQQEISLYRNRSGDYLSSMV